MQIEAFRGGFQEVISLRHLSAFYEDEIETMLCGTGVCHIPWIVFSAQFSARPEDVHI